MSCEKKHSSYNKCLEALDINGDPLDPHRKYLGDKVKIPTLSPNSSFYQNSATIILRGKPVTAQDNKEAKFFEFLNRAPISFNDKEEE
jgi:hypothetical protein